MSAPKLTKKPAELLPVPRILKEVSRRIVGQDAMVERLLVGLLTGGHVLLEGVPGRAETLAVRTLAKVQAALLEAMQEQQVTIGGTTFPLDEPFMVLATQNPIEQEGTYPLPEAQLDRFMLKVRVGYPSRDEEKEVLLRMSGGREITVERLLDPGAILAARAAIAELYLDQKVVDYIVDLVRATRDPGSIG